MVTEFEIRSIEEELRRLDNECSNYLRQEQELHAKITRLHDDLSRCKPSDLRWSSTMSNIKSCEQDLEFKTRSHMDKERQREDKRKELARLRTRMDADRERSVQEKIREQERAKRIASETAIIWGNIRQKRYDQQKNKATTNSSKSSPKKTGCLTRFFSVFLIFVIIGAAVRSCNSPSTPSDTSAGNTDNAITTIDTAKMKMIDFMGLTVSDVEGIYGKDYTIEWLSSGGYWMIYSGDPQKPYAFLYREEGRADNDDKPKPDDLICGIASKSVGVIVANEAQIGMTHSDFEAGIGQTYDAQILPESDYTVPVALLHFEAKGANESEKSEHSLIVLEDDEQVVYVILSK